MTRIVRLAHRIPTTPDGFAGMLVMGGPLGIPGRAERIEADLGRRAKPLNDLGRGLFGRFLTPAECA